MDWNDPVTLGRSGLQVGRLGIGASFGVGTAAIERAFHEHGVNYLYWGSIRRGGMKQAVRNLSAHREDLVVALQTYDHTGTLMRPFCERGLKALKLDYADVLILGWRDSYPSARVIDAAQELVAAGRVRHLAMSGHHRPLFAEIGQRPDNPFDIFMVRYNPAHSGAEKDVFPHLPVENRLGMTTYTSTCWGKLLDAKKMPPGIPPMTAAQCYRFALMNPHVDLCITGPANDRQMEHALSALEAGPLTEEEMAQARAIGDFVHGGGAIAPT